MITRNTKNRVRERCQKGLNTFHAILVLGVKPIGINHKLSTSLYKNIVTPTKLYGCEIWNGLSHSDSECIAKHQHTVVKCIQGLRRRTRSDICESILGIHRLSAKIDKRKLMFLHKLLTSHNSTICQTFYLENCFCICLDLLLHVAGSFPIYVQSCLHVDMGLHIYCNNITTCRPNSHGHGKSVRRSLPLKPAFGGREWRMTMISSDYSGYTRPYPRPSSGSSQRRHQI